MEIRIIPNDYSNANSLAATIESVLKQHPLIGSSTNSVRQRLPKMLIEVKLGTDIQNFDTKVDIKNNAVKLSFGCWHLANGQQFEKALYHEFTHVIDRLNPGFGIDYDSEDKAINIQPKIFTSAGFKLYQHVWNCNIDGRLEKFRQNPRSLTERIQELLDNTEQFGNFTPEADKILENAWNSKNLTFNGIVSLVQKCLQCWQPKEIKDT